MLLNKTKTKLICTIGPSSNHPDTIRTMVKNGMNVVRLNFSHGTHESHKETIKLVRSIAKELNVHISILQDLCGPKIRLGQLPDDGITLTVGDTVALASSNENILDTIPVDYPDLHKEVMPGERILLADGMMELIVIEVKDKKVFCDVLTGGVAFTRKGVNMPQSDLHIDSFSKKDRDDLMLGLQEGVDFVALSFVRRADDLREIKEILNSYDNPPGLIAKIEKPQAIENIDEILHLVDGVMVARGDLGVEIPLEEVPYYQKLIIDKARLAGRFTITATQMLISMVKSPRPTRSEVSDVANAVIDGTDALMLSDETANGAFPSLAVAMLANIAKSSEDHTEYIPDLDSSKFPNSTSFTLAIGRAACWLAKDIKAKAIVTYSSTGFTPYCISRFRPSCSILVLTSNESVCSMMGLFWGSQAIKTDIVEDINSLIELAKQKAIESGLAAAGDNIIVTGGMPIGDKGTTSFLRLVEI